MKILGLSAFYHDSAAALTVDGTIVAAAQEERFSRRKADPSFPHRAISYCLREGALELSQLDAIVYYDKPFLTFERILETYLADAPRGWRSFSQSLPVWIKEKLFLKRNLKDLFAQHFHFRPQTIQFSEHHLSHAASAYFPSPFNEAAILTIDGVGEWCTGMIAHGNENQITCIRKMRFPHSWGLYYSAFTQFLGFKVNSGEYKMMGLAPYGKPNSPEVREFEERIRKNIVTVNDDGSPWLHMTNFAFTRSDQMIPVRRWQEIFAMPNRQPESLINQRQANLALAAQNVLEEGMLKLAREAKRLTGAKALVMAGGVALNCVANGKIHREGIFDELWIQPAADDSGGALGCALALEYISGKMERHTTKQDQMKGSYLGPQFADFEIESLLKSKRIPYRIYDDFAKVCDWTAQALMSKGIIGWFQGRMEWGPRALGNRSILASAQDPEMQRRLNMSIKFRETFRPFAPAVLAEEASKHFEMNGPSPYMLKTFPLRRERQTSLPESFHDWSIGEKLAFPRSHLPAVTHIDFSARVQTVHRDTNPKFHQLLNAYKRLSGIGCLINTSFNIRGEPIVCTPEEAVNDFLRTEMTHLVIGHCCIAKSEVVA